MTSACTTALDAGVIKGVLSAVDCRTRDFAEIGYQSLTGAPVFQTALTLLLTIYVAVLGYRLLFATEGARLTDAPGIALRIGVVLMLVASWSAFQTLVFDLAAKAPLEIAGLAAQPLQAQGSHLAADPVNGLQAAYDQLNAGAAAFGKVSPAVAKSFTSGEAAAGQALSDAASALFATTAGLVSVAAIALGVLTAVGPVFVTLFLFRQTRGLFEGWVRAMIAAALAPMGAWVLIVLMLTVLEPWLAALAEQRAQGVLDVQGGMTVAAIVFVFCAAQLALLCGACIIAVGFRWRARTPSPAQAPAVPSGGAAGEPSATAVETLSRAQRMAIAVRQLDQGLAGLEIRRTTLVRQAAGATPGLAVGGGPIPKPGEGFRRPTVRPRARMGGAR